MLHFEVCLFLMAEFGGKLNWGHILFLLNESQEHIIRSLKVVFPDFVRKGDRKLIVADGIRQKAVSRRQGSASYKRIAHG
jgi:hypothetical protein